MFRNESKQQLFSYVTPGILFPYSSLLIQNLLISCPLKGQRWNRHLLLEK